MSVHASTTLARLEQNLTCPKCAYSLRGLTGDLVTCPECGTDIDRVRLLVLNWNGRWNHAPGYRSLFVPLIVTFIIAIIIGAIGLALFFPIYLLSLWGGATDYSILYKIGISIVAPTWLVLLARAALQFGRPLRGLLLSLLAQLTMIAYAVGLIVGVVSVGMAIQCLATQSPGIVRCVLQAVCTLPLIPLAYYGERFIARQCIRQHLRRQAVALGLPPDDS